jgi:hypothetical protein
MPSSPRAALADPSVFPSDDVLDDVLGASRPAFDALLDHLRVAWPELAGTWKYYRDGASWLFPVARKKTTVFWLSADRDSFRTTFYLASAHEDSLLESALPPALKEQYQATAGKKFRAVTVTLRTLDDVHACRILIAIKLGRAVRDG